MAVNPILSIRLLGGFQIANGQEPATNLERARLQELLAYLLLHHGRPIPRQQADAPCRLDAAVSENHLAQVHTAVDDNERLHYLEQVCYGEAALSERFIPYLQSRIAHLITHGRGRLLTLFLTLYGLAVRRYISGAIVSAFISRQATGNQRAGNAAWPVAE
jgi:hypothetical protein